MGKARVKVCALSALCALRSAGEGWLPRRRYECVPQGLKSPQQPKRNAARLKLSSALRPEFALDL
jgi:hypothetical protein